MHGGLRAHQFYDEFKGDLDGDEETEGAGECANCAGSRVEWPAVDVTGAGNVKA